jgi:hypothetical protein
VPLLRDLCNGAESSEPSKTDPNRHLWVKRWENEPNDKRDAKKYARAAIDYRFKRNWRLAEKRQNLVTAAKSAPQPAAATAGRRRERFRPTFRRRGAR